MNQSSIIVYRNPVEQWWWESGWGPEFVTWGALLLMGAIVLGAATLGGKINAALNSASTHQPMSADVLADTHNGG